MPCAVVRPGLCAVFQRQWRNVAAAETGIGNPRLPAEVHQKQRVGARRYDAWVQPQQYARQQRPVDQPHRGERVAEQAVLLEAIASAPAQHQLLEHAGAVDADALTQRDRQILEADELAVRGLQLGKLQGRGRECHGKTDAGEVAIEIHGAVLHLPSLGSKPVDKLFRSG